MGEVCCATVRSVLYGQLGTGAVFCGSAGSGSARQQGKGVASRGKVRTAKHGAVPAGEQHHGEPWCATLRRGRGSYGS